MRTRKQLVTNGQISLSYLVVDHWLRLPRDGCELVVRLCLARQPHNRPILVFTSALEFISLPLLRADSKTKIDLFLQPHVSFVAAVEEEGEGEDGDAVVSDPDG